MTQHLFLENSYLKEMDATLVETGEGLVLDQTVFYPRGGGQSTDQGFLIAEGWKGKVSQVLIKEGKTVHFVEGTPPPVGTRIKGILDWERRYLHMRLHSAGHVVDFALHLLGLPFMPLRGDHGKKPVITYQGTVERDFREELEKKSNELVAQNLAFTTRFASFEEIEKVTLYLQPGLPKDKPLRLLTLEGVGSVADGGTQVARTSEVGKITILPLEKAEGTTLVHYRI